MVTAADLLPYRVSSDDYELTQELKARLAHLRGERQPMYLAGDEFDQILRWKLRGQYGRQRAWRQCNTEDVIRAVTGLALSVCHTDPDYELELRMGALCTLRGVQVPVASAVLALVYPETYAVVDFRGWRQVFGREPTGFTIAGYRKYLGEIRRLSDELGWYPQEVDLAIWEYDRVKGWNRS